MYQKIYSVYDKKAAAYLRPFFMRTDAEAVRAITNTAKDSASLFAANPSDFQLVQIGEWDDATGVISPSGVRVIVDVGALGVGVELDLDRAQGDLEELSLKQSVKERFEQECG